MWGNAKSLDVKAGGVHTVILCFKPQTVKFYVHVCKSTLNMFLRGIYRTTIHEEEN
jgi:hypothetical protein